jgi:alanyl-tRNA synthetase
VTKVTFPQGEVSGTAQVLRIEGDIVVTDQTPFHPVDHTWPDQPGDSGTISSDHQKATITDAVMAAVSDDGTFAVGEEIPVKRGAEGWTWHVGHRLAAAAPAWLTLGVTVTLEVDAERRASLSRGHTACHLSSLALDGALADLWHKEIRTDDLGAPDFEGQANQTSFIHADGAVDEYRLGKSLRKAGFDSEGLANSLAVRETRINEKLAQWVASGASSQVETDGPLIADRRRWRCELPEGDVTFPCGGTHVDSLSAYAAITVKLEMPDLNTLVMTTIATPRD